MLCSFGVAESEPQQPYPKVLSTGLIMDKLSHLLPFLFHPSPQSPGLRHNTTLFPLPGMSFSYSFIPQIFIEHLSSADRIILGLNSGTNKPGITFPTHKNLQMSKSSLCCAVMLHEGKRWGQKEGTDQEESRRFPKRRDAYMVS